jgi:hypothetical protein
MMEAELFLLLQIRTKYRQYQEAQFGLDHKRTSRFTLRVRAYLAALLVLQFLNLVAVFMIWVPKALTIAGPIPG